MEERRLEVSSKKENRGGGEKRSTEGVPVIVCVHRLPWLEKKLFVGTKVARSFWVRGRKKNLVRLFCCIDIGTAEKSST